MGKAKGEPLQQRDPHTEHRVRIGQRGGGGGGGVFNVVVVVVIVVNDVVVAVAVAVVIIIIIVVVDDDVVVVIIIIVVVVIVVVVVVFIVVVVTVIVVIVIVVPFFWLFKEQCPLPPLFAEALGSAEEELEAADVDGGIQTRGHTKGNDASNPLSERRGRESKGREVVTDDFR
jgi:hypothetical protein